MRKETYMRLSGNDRGLQPSPLVHSYPVKESPEPTATKPSYSRTTNWADHDVLYGNQLDQWLCGLLGALVTTLPSFILMPIWFSFTNHTKIQKENGKVDCETCFIINFAGGILIWVIAIIAWQL